MEQIYVDHAATSPIHPKVIETMMNVMNSEYGNPSSIHSFGRGARHIIDEARAEIAKIIGAEPNEIIFTSGGTEADNHAIFGVANSYKHQGKHIITSQMEHHAVLHTCKQLEKEGFEVTYLPVDIDGRVSVEDVKNALREDTILVTIMYANNEVGTIQPIEEIGKILANHSAIFHTDAVQAFGLENIHVRNLGIDLMSVTAHKINGPKGIGFLYVNKEVKLSSLLFGGEQERKRRAGTENVASIAGLLEAIRISQQEMENKTKLYMELKSAFTKILAENEVEYFQNGSLDYSLPHVLNLSFPGTNVEAMLVNLDLAGIAASSGSACTAGSIDPSHVLVAMYGKNDDRIQNSIRFSFGLNNTLEQIERVADETSKIVKRLTK